MLNVSATIFHHKFLISLMIFEGKKAARIANPNHHFSFFSGMIVPPVRLTNHHTSRLRAENDHHRPSSDCNRPSLFFSDTPWFTHRRSICDSGDNCHKFCTYYQIDKRRKLQLYQGPRFLEFELPPILLALIALKQFGRQIG